MDELKKEFENKFVGDKSQVWCYGSEVWKFFAPHLQSKTHDKELLEKFIHWFLTAHMTFYYDENGIDEKDVLDKFLTEVDKIVLTGESPKQKYDPKSPNADKYGYVTE